MALLQALIRNLRRKQAKIDAIGNGAAGGFCSEASEGGSSTKLSVRDSMQAVLSDCWIMIKDTCGQRYV